MPRKYRTAIQSIFEYAQEMISYVDEIDRSEYLQRMLDDARDEYERLVKEQNEATNKREQ